MKLTVSDRIGLDRSGANPIAIEWDRNGLDLIGSVLIGSDWTALDRIESDRISTVGLDRMILEWVG